MQFNGVYVAQEASQSVAAADVLVELQAAAGTVIEILRMWIGATEGADPVTETQEVEIYLNDAVATSGTALTEQALQGTAPTSGVTALGGPTIGATPTSVYRSAYHMHNGWLYLPVPEERIRAVGGGSGLDNVGFRFPVLPDAAAVVSYGVIWGEYTG